MNQLGEVIRIASYDVGVEEAKGSDIVACFRGLHRMILQIGPQEAVERREIGRNKAVTQQEPDDVIEFMPAGFVQVRGRLDKGCQLIGSAT